MTVAYILDLLRILIICGSLFGVGFYLLKQWNAAAKERGLLQFRSEQNKVTTSMRMQAYERFSLLCERIAIPSLLVRLRTENSTTRELQGALMLAVQQEFEYNISQQIYISDNLWQILRLCRDNTMMLISQAGSNVDSAANSMVLATELLNLLDSQQVSITDTALQAIKTEAAQFL